MCSNDQAATCFDKIMALPDHIIYFYSVCSIRYILIQIFGQIFMTDFTYCRNMSLIKGTYLEISPLSEKNISVEMKKI